MARSEPQWGSLASCLRPPIAPAARRLQALAALIAAKDRSTLDCVAAILAAPKQNSAALRGAILAALGRSDDPRVAAIVLGNYRRLEPELQPKAIELLTQRTAWAKPLLEAIGRHEVPSNALNVNQVRRLLAGRDKQLAALVAAKWGSIRADRNPQREQVVADVRKLLQNHHGDAQRGDWCSSASALSAMKSMAKGNRSAPISLRTAGRRSTNCSRMCSIRAW